MANIKTLLREQGHDLRSFDSLKLHIGGFTDDELRKLLVSCGAVRFLEEGTSRELWGLVERNSALLTPAIAAPRSTPESATPLLTIGSLRSLAFGTRPLAGTYPDQSASTQLANPLRAQLSSAADAPATPPPPTPRKGRGKPRGRG
jgi:hypothetical protein